MGKITLRVRTILIVFFLLSSSLTFLTATSSNSAAITITGTEYHVSCSNGNDGAINTTISGGNGNYTITWTGTSQTSGNISGLTAGSYTITVKDTDNTSVSKEFSITQPDPLQLTASTTTAVTCNGVSDGSITAGNVTGGTGPYQYSIDNISFNTNPTFTGLSAGNYTIYVKDANACTVEKQITVVEPAILSMATSTSTPVSCNNGNDGTITAGEPSGGNGEYQYSKDGTTFSSSKLFSNLIAGNYTITVRDKLGCEISQLVNVDQPPVLTMESPTSNPVSCNGGNDGAILAGPVDGGRPGYQYSIDGTNFSNSNSFSGLTAGTYTITVKDANGCTKSETGTVSEPTLITMAVSSSTPVSCNAGNDGSITAGTVSGGNGNYQYKLNSGAYGTSKSFNNLSSGTYTITVKDAKGCETSQSITVTQPDVLSMAAPTSTPVSCNGGNDGTVTAGTVSGGNGSFQYKLNSGSYGTSNSFNGLTAGNYTITVKDSKDCETSQSITVGQPDALTMAAPTFTVVSCHGGNDGSLTAGTVSGGNGNYLYKLNTGSYGTSNSFNALTSGSYTITVKDSKGCETSQTITVTQPEVLAMTAPTFTAVSCNGVNNGVITVGDASGGNGEYRYSINGNNFGTSKVFNNLPPGNYTVTVQDAKGCIATQSIEVTEPAELAMTDATSSLVSCFGGNDGTITVGNTTGGTSPYQFSIDNTNFNTTGFFENVEAGIHTIFVKDANGCSLQKTVNVAENPILKATTTKIDVPCFGESKGSITITNATGGSGTYDYSLDATNWQSGATFNNLPSSSYTVFIRDRNNPGCQIILQDNFIIAQPEAALATEVTTTRTTTIGTATGSATANPTGGTAGYTYEWRKQNENPILFTTKTINNVLAGNYRVTVKDSKGCTVIKDFKIIDVISAEIIPTSICESDESIIRTSFFELDDLTALGGVAPYTYSWSFGSGASIGTASTPGPHRVTYSSTGDKNISVTVTDGENVSRTFNYLQYVGECYRDNCGSNDFANTEFFIGDAFGNRITDVTCSLPDQNFIYIVVPTGPERYSLYVEINYTLTNFSTGLITTRQVGNCFYSKQPIPDIAKTFAVDWSCGDKIVVDNIYFTFSNNIRWDCGQGPNPKCYSTNTGELVNAPLFARADPNILLCNGSQNGEITVTASGGTFPYDYSITSANNGYQRENIFNGLAGGTYTVWVRDSQNRIFSIENVLIDEPNNALELEINPALIDCFGGTTNVQGVATGGTEPYEYLWNDPAGQTTAIAENLVAGSYTLTVIDVNGCQEIKTVVITEPEKLTVAEAGDDQSFNCGFNSTFLEANTPETGVGTWTILSGTGGFLTSINDPNTEFTGGEDTYTLQWTIAHEDGTCSTTDEVQITFVEDCRTLDFDGVDDHIVFGNEYGFSSGTFSMEAWVKLKSTNGVKTILSKSNIRNPGEGGFDLIINQGAPTFRWGNSSVSSSSKLGTQRWYHIAVIFLNSRANLYVDGIRVGNATATNPSATPFPFLIGGGYDKDNPEIPQNYFHGWIEEVRLWNKALTEEQLRFMMNQRLEVGTNPVKGEVLPMNVPGNLDWTSLGGYYQLLVNEAASGITKDKAANKVDGFLKNITTLQDNTAPLPYISAIAGTWRDRNIWAEPEVWDSPNSQGINGENINWNIVKINKDITSGGQDINLLGLLSSAGTLTIANPGETLDWQNSGQALRVSHYLKLNGNIILVGESQLVQTDIKTAAEVKDYTFEFPQSITSVLEESSTGYIERAQQGTANSFNYNYWSSPVSKQRAANNSTYTVKEVMKDGSSTANYGEVLDFNDWHEYPDYTYDKNAPRRVSNYWINKFRGTANVYSEWVRIKGTGILQAGEGYTMKGTSGQAAIAEKQNYVYRGKPNNGTIPLNIQQNQNYLLGNPYPSSIDVNKFILDNLNSANVAGGTNTRNIFNGALYFWDHFAGGDTHILLEYIGGYATRNLIDGVPAISNDYRINANDEEGSKIPGQFIPVAQGFFINSVIDPAVSGNITVDGGDVLFKNSQRIFMRESSGNTGNSVFLRPEVHSKQSAEVDKRAKIRLDFTSPKGYHRQILVGVDLNTTSGVDLGYDAPINDYNLEDMYWLIGTGEFVIQGVPDFNLTRVLPLGMRISKEGKFTIEINELKNVADDVTIYLKDKAEKTYHDLRKSPFEGNIAIGNFSNRYEIVFQKEIDTENTTDPDVDEGGVDNPDSGNGGGVIDEKTEISPEVFFLEGNMELVVRNPELHKITNLTLHSLSGQIIQEYGQLATEKEVTLPVRGFSSSVYIVKMYTEQGVIIKKLIISN